MTPPICWKSFAFAFSRSDDRDNHYSGQTLDGRLTYSRSFNLWCATLHGASAVVEGGREGAGDHEAARRALDEAVVALQRRVATDQALLARIEEETG